MAPDFLRVDEVLRIHEDQIERYGGSPELRDPGLLLAAVDMPRATFDGSFLHKDLFEMAAAYLFHIVQDHPFVDGNKRTGTVAALVFLEMNGIEVDADNDVLAGLVLSVAQGKSDKAKVAAFLREHAVA